MESKCPTRSPPAEPPSQSLHPKMRDKTLVRRALKRLMKKGLAAWYRARKGRTVTITPQGKQLAKEHCPQDWERIRRGEL